MSDSRIIRTKLYPPAITGDIVCRPALLEELNRARDLPLTLVSAPAGYGKSILASCWLEACGMPGAWLSLADDENDLRLFLRYFVAAVQTVFPDACQETLNILEARELPPPAVLAGQLGNDLDTLDERLVLVLDDLQLVHTSAAYDVLDDLLRYPPRAINLVLVTRRDPPLSLSALRARGKLAEVRERDLRFSRVETRTVLERVTGVQIGESALSRLHDQIEGWIVGLRLVCLALRHEENPDTYLERLFGGTRSVQDYLIDEVLFRQSETFQTCLLETSILDRYCASLCEAVCPSLCSRKASGDKEAGDWSSNGERFLDELHQANMFSVKLDADGKWHRYHHLFQKLLQRQLELRVGAEGVAALHIRAGEWFESEGLVDEAIGHALAAGNVELAADIVERHRHIELNEDRWAVVEKWLGLLPDETKQVRPGLLLSQAWVAYYRLQNATIESLVSRAEPLLSSDQDVDPVSLAELDFFRSILHYWAGEANASKRSCERAIERIPVQRGLFGGEIRLYLALARQMAGEGSEAVESLKKDVREADTGDHGYLSRLFAANAYVHLLSGDLAPVVPAGKRLSAVSQRWPSIYAGAWGHYVTALANFHTYYLDEATEDFQIAVERRVCFEDRAVVDAFAGLILSLQFSRDSDHLASVAEGLTSFVQELMDPECTMAAESCRARLSLLQGTLEPAIEWARGADTEADIPGMLFWLENPWITRARIRIAEGSPASLRQAIDSLETLRPKVEALHSTCHTIEILVLLSAALDKQGRTEKGLGVLRKAVALAHPGGWLRPFVEAGPGMDRLLAELPRDDGNAIFIKQILSTIGEAGEEAKDGVRTQPHVQPLIEPLTNRELDILELLAERLYDKEIADRLSIGPGTVKSHLKHIYGKLNVGNRRQAVIKAEELGLLQKG